MNEKNTSMGHMRTNTHTHTAGADQVANEGREPERGPRALAGDGQRLPPKLDIGAAVHTRSGA